MNQPLRIPLLSIGFIFKSCSRTELRETDQ